MAVQKGLQDAKRIKSDQSGPPPENYVCKICQVTGVSMLDGQLTEQGEADYQHWIKDCPQKSEPRDPSKPPTGYTCNICQSVGSVLIEV
jgi:hypothetical protein